MRFGAAALGVAALLWVPGCLDSPGGGEHGTYPIGDHPWPSEADWPRALRGPFELHSIEKVKIPGAAGAMLDGWIIRPALPEGVGAPVVLWSAPYFGQCSYMPPTPPFGDLPPEYPYCSYDVGSDPGLRDANTPAEAVPVDRLIEEGYAVAVVNVRGSGNSSGCFDNFGPLEQADQALIVEWLGEQPWSNGRVAMMGLSYHGTTPWEAAIQNPPHLKTIIVGGMISDLYTFSHTPQGAKFPAATNLEAMFFVRSSASPPINAPLEHWTVNHASVLPERACLETVKTLGEEWSGTYTDLRNGAYWDERRLIDRFPDITAAVLLTHGFDDLVDSGHQAQENAVWNTLLQAPKRQLEGQWTHMMPDFDPEFESTYGQHWHDVAVSWLDFWLKGEGSPDKLGLVEYQDSDEVWHTSSSWPPAEAHQEVLYLNAGGLTTVAGSGSASFRSAPTADGPRGVLCGSPPLGTEASGLVYLSPAATSKALVAGNPWAYLQVESDLPGGLVAIDLYDVGETCSDATFWGRGVADLRFHDGRFTGTDYPTGSPRAVRIDITDFAQVLPAGHRLAVVASFGAVLDRTGQPYFPTITLHGDGSATSSHLVLPIVEGGFGAAAPTLDYPPRPFVPQVTQP